MDRIKLVTLTMAMTAWLGTAAEGTDKAIPAGAVPSLLQNAAAISNLSDGSPVFNELVKREKTALIGKNMKRLFPFTGLPSPWLRQGQRETSIVRSVLYRKKCIDTKKLGWPWMKGFACLRRAGKSCMPLETFTAIPISTGRI
ncbi:hypothetical protein [uncultured Dialister sp.]|uniref:hypothetical protein n=1 Tax=uncultured Dialister sp. TaxID=278064 RepID=UPI0025E1D908|nr:hypothetical protein [uncultured Dialister sp.]